MPLFQPLVPKGNAKRGPAVVYKKLSADELCVLVLSWAKHNMPDAYHKTIESSTKGETFRKYLLRLVERRWEQDKDWRREVPLAALEETSISATVKVGDREVVFSGEKVEHRKMSWMVLATATRGQLEELLSAVEILDMEIA